MTLIPFQPAEYYLRIALHNTFAAAELRAIGPHAVAELAVTLMQIGSQSVMALKNLFALYRNG